jgi:hypothetical protein
MDNIRSTTTVIFDGYVKSVALAAKKKGPLRGDKFAAGPLAFIAAGVSSPKRRRLRALTALMSLAGIKDDIFARVSIYWSRETVKRP